MNAVRAAATGAALATALLAALGSAGAADAPELRGRALPGVRPQTTALALTGRDLGDLPVALTAAPVVLPAGNLLVAVELAGERLASGDADAAVPIELALFAVDSSGKIAAFLAEGVRLEASARVAERTLRYLGLLSLPPGGYSLRLVVRQRASDRFAVRALPVRLPTAPPLSAPSGLEVAKAGDLAVVCERCPAAAQLDAWLRAAPADLVARTAPLATAAKAEAAAAAPSPSTEGRSRKLEAAQRRALRAALERAARGDRDGAASALVEAQRLLLRDRPRLALAAIDEAARLEATALALVDPEALVPFVDLEQRLFVAHQAAGRPGAARLALAQARFALTTYLARRTAPEARDLAATRLLGLAGALAEAGLFELAAELAREVGGLRPGDPLALLTEATFLERRDRRLAADDALARLLAAQPTHREARLRRAVLAARRGDDERAETLLRQLLAEPVADWVTAVAAAERARALAGARREAEAVALLREVQARLPRDPGVGLALAWAEARGGDRGRALDQLERLVAQADFQADSPRRRYSRWPERELAAAARAAGEAAAVRLPALAVALAKLAPESDS